MDSPISGHAGADPRLQPIFGLAHRPFVGGADVEALTALPTFFGDSIDGSHPSHHRLEGSGQALR